MAWAAIVITRRLLSPHSGRERLGALKHTVNWKHTACHHFPAVYHVRLRISGLAKGFIRTARLLGRPAAWQSPDAKRNPHELWTLFPNPRYHTGAVFFHGWWCRWFSVLFLIAYYYCCYCLWKWSIRTGFLLMNYVALTAPPQPVSIEHMAEFNYDK